MVMYRFRKETLMPRSVSDIVDELDDMLKNKIRLGGTEPVLTIQWPDFYALCEVTRFKSQRELEIQKESRAKFGLIVAYGEKVVLVAHDRNFAPAKN